MATQNIYSVTPDNRVVRTASDYESNPYLTRLSESDRSVVRGGLDYAQSQIIAEGERTLGQLSSMRAEDYAATALGEARASAYETAYDVKNRAAATGAVGVDNVLEQINKNLAQQESEIISGAQKDIATMRSDYQKGLIDTLNTYGEAQQKQEAAYVKAVDDLINYFFAYGGKVLDSTERGWGEEVLKDDALIEQYAKDAGYLDEYGNFTTNFMIDFGDFYYGDTMEDVSEALENRNYDLWKALESNRGRIAESIGGLYERDIEGNVTKYKWDGENLLGHYSTDEEIAQHKYDTQKAELVGEFDVETEQWGWRTGGKMISSMGAIKSGDSTFFNDLYISNVKTKDAAAQQTFTSKDGKVYVVSKSSIGGEQYKDSVIVGYKIKEENIEEWDAQLPDNTKNSIQSLVKNGSLGIGSVFTGLNGQKYLITRVDKDRDTWDIRAVKIDEVKA